jgi:hypothetical protein
VATIEQTKQTPTKNSPELNQDPTITKAAHDLGNTILGPERPLSPLSLDGLDEMKGREADAVNGLLRIPFQVIDESFGGQHRGYDSKEVEELRKFNTTVVRTVTGLPQRKAAEAITDQSSFVSTVVHGIASSEKFQDRLVYDHHSAFADSSPNDAVSFAMMHDNAPGSPDTIVRISHAMRGEGADRHPVELIHAESLLRESVDPGSCVVLDMEEGKQPQMSQRIYRRGGYQGVPITDPESAEQNLLALMGDMGMAYSKYQPENDAAAIEAAKDGSLRI